MIDVIYVGSRGIILVSIHECQGAFVPRLAHKIPMTLLVDTRVSRA